MKTVIITGARSGIGKATAIKLKKMGFNVVGSYFSGLSSAKEIENKYDIKFIECNVSNYDSVENLFEFAKRTYGKIDVVIANAGVALTQGLLIDQSAKDIAKVVETNFLGSAYTNKLAVSSMLNNGGKIINVSSIFGLVGGSCEAIYSATKSAVIGLTRALSEELESSSVEVCAIAPGLIDTKMNSHLSLQDKLSFLKECGLETLPIADDVADEIYKIISTSESVNGRVFKLFTGKY